MKANNKLRYGGGGMLTLVPVRYTNGRPGIRAETAGGEPVATLSVNLPYDDMKQDELAVKEWSENEGAADTLINAGIIDPRAHRSVTSGFVQVPVYKLTPLGHKFVHAERK